MRINPREAVGRVFASIVRGTLKKVDDAKKLQSVDLDLLFNESKREVERFQQYGITSVPKDETDDGVAEAIVLFLGGERSHGIVLAIDDRRFRLKNLKSGEVAIYDDQGQVVHLTRDGIKLDTEKWIKATAKQEVEIKSSEGAVKIDSTQSSITARAKTDGILRNDKVSVNVTGETVKLGTKEVMHAVVTLDGPSEVVFASLNEKENS